MIGFEPDPPTLRKKEETHQNLASDRQKRSYSDGPYWLNQNYGSGSAAHNYDFVSSGPSRGNFKFLIFLYDHQGRTQKFRKWGAQGMKNAKFQYPLLIVIFNSINFLWYYLFNTLKNT